MESNPKNYNFSTIVGFRFLSLTAEQADNLKQIISDCEIDNHFENGCKCGCISLDSIEKLDLIVQFKNEHCISNDECDIFLSIATENDTEIWDVPSIVNDAIKRIDCKLVFSFTSID